jgi:hypothetical protein
MVYIVKKNGEKINTIEINPAQVERFAAATGYELVPYIPEEPAAPPATDVNADMEQALNELGVETRE